MHQTHQVARFSLLYAVAPQHPDDCLSPVASMTEFESKLEVVASCNYVGMMTVRKPL